jgi:hypothetical protein
MKSRGNNILVLKSQESSLAAPKPTESPHDIIMTLKVIGIACQERLHQTETLQLQLQ